MGHRLSNLRQITIAFQRYVNKNKGKTNRLQHGGEAHEHPRRVDTVILPDLWRLKWSRDFDTTKNPPRMPANFGK